MRKESWLVKKKDYNKYYKVDCFYCKSKLGQEHEVGCVTRKRSVVVNFSIDIVIGVPEDWDDDMVEFNWNESYSCSSNVIGVLERLSKRKGCLCGLLETSFVREATEEDEVMQKFKLKG